MTNNKQRIINLLRKLRLLHLADYVGYVTNLRKHQQRNKVFVETHPNFRLPPSGLAYDAYGHTSWAAYYRTGKEHARYMSTLIRTYCSGPSLAICEWGCGPARILRQLPPFFDDRTIRLYGFDYNPRTIRWCQDNIFDIVFKHNFVAPPLDQGSNSFDCLYSVSVFTHLSRDMHFEWIKELSRVVKPNGIIILTTHGDLAKANLLEQERNAYEQGELVVRDKVQEGKRTFVAYHPPSFVQHHLLKNLQVISHITNPIPHSLSQDIWIARNTKI